MQNIDSDLIRGNIDTIILKTMLDGDKYGLDIIKEVETRSNGTYVLKQPTLYSCLKRLENQELISSYWLDSDIGGRRHYYKLTDKGRETLEKKQEEWIKSKFIIDNLLSNYNYDEYRLVSKDDYDRIIEEKQFTYEKQEEIEQVNQESTQEENLQETYPTHTEDENYEFVNHESDLDEFHELESDESQENYHDLEEPSLEIEEFDYSFDKTENNEILKSEEYSIEENDSRFYFDASDSQEDSTNNYVQEETDQSAEELNILAKLRSQDEEEVNEYIGDQKSYINHLNQDFESAEQTNMLNLETENNNYVDDSINQFTSAIEALRKFNNQENYTEIENSDNNLQEVTSDEFIQQPEYKEEDNYEYSNSKYEDTLKDELSVLKNSSNSGFFNSFDAPDYHKTQTINEPKFESPISNIENNNLQNFNLNDLESESINENFVDSFDNNEDENIEHFNNYAEFDNIISSNVNSYSNQITETQNSEFSMFKPVYGGAYKEKLSNLSTYSKVTLDEPEPKEINSEALAKAKDIETLKTEFEQEGIKFKEFKKYNANEQSEKTYLLSNKIGLINSLILLFGYMFLLSAVYIILNNTAFKDTFGFSIKYFLFGFIPFGIYALYHIVLYIINPYKKVQAKLAPRILIFIAIIMTIQLLLITYCINLQFGFYSFVQEQYNHLLWVIPTIISFAPIACNVSYICLFYSKNFNV